MTSSPPPGLVIDTGIVAAIIYRNLAKPDKPFFTKILQHITGATLVCSHSVYAETIYGAVNANASNKELARIDAAMQKFRLVWPNPRLSDEYARLRSGLPKGHGFNHKPAEADRWTAAVALMLDVPLLTTDKGYAGVPGLNHILVAK